MAQSKISTNINILLLGEIGAGKSTFINAFANYLTYRKFSTAERKEVLHLIPAQFSVPIGLIRQKTIRIGTHEDSNTPYSYVFSFNQIGIDNIRIINTPGIEGIEGINRDNENFKDILAHISQFQTLDAICFVLKPNNPGFRDSFKYCIRHILPKLSRNAFQNIVFLFTHTRSTFYKLGDAVSDIKAVLNRFRDYPPYVNIKFEKDSNVFCLDNEAFRYLVAANNRIDLGNKKIFEESWNHSVKECYRLINYITGNGNFTTSITPHRIMDTLFLNRVYFMIVQLSTLLIKLTKYQNLQIEEVRRNYEMAMWGDQMQIERAKNLIAECEKEKCFIIKTIADCGYFLENSAIALFADIYMSFVVPVIRREQGHQSDAQLIECCERLMIKYNEQKQYLRLSMPSTANLVKFVFESIRPLYNLPITGKNIQELIERNPILQTDQHRSEKILQIDRVRRKIKSWDSTSSVESTSPQFYQQDQNIPKDRGYVQNHLQGKAANLSENRNYPNVNRRQDFQNHEHKDREINANRVKREQTYYQSEADLNNITRNTSQMNIGHNQTNPQTPQNLHSPPQYNQNFSNTNYFPEQIPFNPNIPSTSNFQASYPQYPQNFAHLNQNWSNYPQEVYGNYPIHHQGPHQNFQPYTGNQSYYQTKKGAGNRGVNDSNAETSLLSNNTDESEDDNSYENEKRNSNGSEDDNFDQTESGSSICTETDSQASSNKNRK